MEYSHCVGAWRSLVARTVRVGEVPGSNPGAPITKPDSRSAWSELGDEQYCYLTTRGRVTGQPHRIEIWFALDEDTLYMLSGGGERSDWVKNLRRAPAVIVEVGSGRFAGQARVVTDRVEDERARAIVHEKYARSYSGDLSRWRRSALPIAVDLEGPPGNDSFASAVAD